MSALAVAFLALLAFTSPSVAQCVNGDQPGCEYTVWSSVVLTRTGERTPEVLGRLPTTLTNRGATQAYQAGQFFRQRYIDSAYQEHRNVTNGAQEGGAPLYGLAPTIFDPLQIFAIALGQQYNLGTAQAFLQGLYPPWTPNDTHSSTPGGVDPLSILANGSYTEAPLNGYQYPHIHAAGPGDYNYIYLSGNMNCLSWENAAAAYSTTREFDANQEQFDKIYDALGPAVFEGVLDSEYWDYTNAYAIYDYLRYQYDYNNDTRTELNRYEDVTTNTSYIDILRWLADAQQYAQLGNISAINPISNENGLPGVQGSISTIAGNMLGARIMDGFADAINSAASGRDQYRLNLLFADYHPFMSFFALVGLPEFDSDFYGTPDFASSAAFELFSYTNSSQTTQTFPNTSDLWVRFYFRNGTDADDKYVAYSLFNRGRSQMDMMWSDFEYEMQNLLILEVGDWCSLCNSTSIFCSAWNQDLSKFMVQGWLEGHSVSVNSGRRMGPAVAGVIGAVIALVLAGIVFGLLMLLAGVRVRRDRTSFRRSSDLGGFKGGQKMRSDQDLTIPKGGAVVGASVEANSPMSPVAGGHERVGSWELKSAEAGSNPFTLNVPDRGPEMRQSMESATSRKSLKTDPFVDPTGIKPTEPRTAV